MARLSLLRETVSRREITDDFICRGVNVSLGAVRSAPPLSCVSPHLPPRARVCAGMLFLCINLHIMSVIVWSMPTCVCILVCVYILVCVCVYISVCVCVY